MRNFAIFLVLLTGISCAPSLHERGRRLSDAGRYDQAIELLSIDIANNPQSSDSWRELGIACYRQGDLGRAAESLRESLRIAASARAYLFLGLIHERERRPDDALTAYRAALALGPGDPLEALLGRRVKELTPGAPEGDGAKADKRGARESAGEAVAVMDFDPSGLPPEFAALGRGLAAMTAADLRKIGALRVIDRRELISSLQKQGMDVPGFGDPEANERAASLAGAKRLITGSLQMRGQGELKLYGAVAQPQAGRFLTLDPVTGDLERFYSLQKDFVAALLDSMDLAVLPEERAAALAVQTQSLSAFMAFCRGLDLEDQGLTEAAAEQFKDAVAKDEDFTAALEKIASIPDSVETVPTQSAKEAPGFEDFEAAVTAGPLSSAREPGRDRILEGMAARWGTVRDAEALAQAPQSPVRLPGATITVQGEPNGQR